MRYSLLGIALVMTMLSACGGKQQQDEGNAMAPPASGTASDTHQEHPLQPNPSEGSSGE